ncbi:MAG: glutathione S-transferase N-terminal domain-containing protein [Gammaproteobacteria bacterium AqS3]|nr:glutathione S-transferase N-terminal domain-containing protein [Gammaproteobacteria bacterium AqS3]
MITKLYSDPAVHYSHRVRIALEIKDVAYESINVNSSSSSSAVTERLLEINPTGRFPCLIDDGVQLDDRSVILEYIEERFPHPPLLPVYPKMRAKCRQWTNQLENDVIPRVNRLMNSKTAERNRIQARKEVLERLLQIGRMIGSHHYVLGGISNGEREHDVFTLADCCLFPILWRLERMGIELPSTKSGAALNDYLARLLKRDSIRLSLSDEERKMRKITAAQVK